jgi:arylsulfatase A-like enzyme
MKRRGAAFLLTALLLGALLSSCNKKQAAPESLLFSKANDLPNIALISIDTLRGDYFSPEHMPLTYAWAQKNCYIYTDAQSCSTWTKPSHVTMLTGLRQKEHDVEFHEDMIPPDLPMVQERLKQIGYSTLAFVSGGYVEKEFGFDRGFDKFWEIQWKGHRPLKDDGEAFTRAYSYLEESDASIQPFFLFAHTHMVHQFWADFFPGCTADQGDETRKNFQLQASLETRRELYAAAVKACDRKLYGFVQFLVQSFPNIRIIITSDHGEGLGEYYEAGDVYKEVRSFNHESIPTPDQTYVPLIVYGFGAGITDRLELMISPEQSCRLRASSPHPGKVCSKNEARWFPNKSGNRTWSVTSR